jgi:hypothetical protein
MDGRVSKYLRLLQPLGSDLSGMPKRLTAISIKSLLMIGTRRLRS